MKAATQSETLWNYDPNLAVDGDSNTCSFTPQSDVQRWWQVNKLTSNRVLVSVGAVGVAAPTDFEIEYFCTHTFFVKL